MTITLGGAALYVVIVILIFVVGILVTGAIVREWIRQRVKKEEKDKELIRAIKSVQFAMQAVCRRVNDKAGIAKENHVQVMAGMHEIAELVEKTISTAESRLTVQIQETRQVFQSPRRDGTKIYNTNADGGQTNQGGSVHGEQR